MSIIEGRGITKSFGSQTVLSGLNLNVATGSFVAIIGGSGCGKSTLLKIITGLLGPDAGQMLVWGQNIAQITSGQLAQIRRRIGMVFQQSSLWDAKNVHDNLALIFEYDNQSAIAQIEQQIAQALSTVNMTKDCDKLPSQLSGGERKRIAIARAIVHRPELILYDEPTVNLDPANKDIVVELMRAIHQQKSPNTTNTTSVIVSHDLDVLHLADSILLLEDGHLYDLGRPQDLSKDSLLKIFRGVIKISERRC